MPRPGTKRFYSLPAFFLLGLGATLLSQTPLSAEEVRAAENAPAPSGIRATVKKIVQDSYSYDASVRQKILAAKVEPNDVMTLEAVTVVESTDTPGLRAHLEQQRRTTDSAKPSLSRGVSVGGKNTSVGVMKFKEIIPFGNPTPRWTLINFKF